MHGETYHVKVSGSGRKIDGRKPYYIRVNDKLEEVSLEPIQEVLAGVPEAPRSRQSGGKTQTSQAVQTRRRGSSDAGPSRESPGGGRRSVKAGDPLLIIEAMKMESQVPAPIDGRVTVILVAEGDNVKTDETVIQLE